MYVWLAALRQGSRISFNPSKMSLCLTSLFYVQVAFLGRIITSKKKKITFPSLSFGGGCLCSGAEYYMKGWSQIYQIISGTVLMSNFTICCYIFRFLKSPTLRNRKLASTRFEGETHVGHAQAFIEKIRTTSSIKLLFLINHFIFKLQHIEI